MTGPRRVTAEALVRLRRSLSERDLAILASLADCRFLTSRQLQRWHFPVGDQADQHTPAGADRVTRRVLARLAEQRLLWRLDRRIGGARAGSAGFVYALGALGQRTLELPGARRRQDEPSTLFLEHTLEISEIIVGLVEADRGKRLELISCETEPRCWRTIPGSDVTLKPDLRITLGAGEQELHWFIEVDLGNVHMPGLLRKCRNYLDYYRSGKEQAEAGVFPAVAWLTPRQRVDTLTAAIAGDGGLPDRLFIVVPIDGALARLGHAGDAS